MGELHDPFLFPQMEAVCARLQAAIAAGEQICVHGDYDVDGITSTALLVTILSEMGAKVSHHLPNRFTEGYGIALPTVEKIAAGGASLLVTVDCGIGAREQLGRARELGMDVIVIDHHRPVADQLPDAEIISPLLCDYPFKELAGVGLAFKVAQALVAGGPGAGPGSAAEDSDGENPSLAGPVAAGEDLPSSLKRLLDLVALGTIADVVPLLGENRSLVKRGLNQMARSKRPGLRALMQVGQVEPSNLSAGLVAFRMAPRLNAAGRLEDPEPALKLLLAEEEKEAAALADELDSLNRERQRIENQMVAEAEEQIGRLTEEEKARRGYVLSSPRWHEGVIGIVASRMVEQHHRPVIMVAENETHGKGSGRSIPAFDLHG
jgi:single-stranded-DNA-specific exonuclease